MWIQSSTTCSNFTEVAQWGAPSCSQPQPATDNGVRDGRSNWLVVPPTLHRAVPTESHILHTAMRAGLQITGLAALSEPRTCDLRNARPTHCLCGHSGYYIWHDAPVGQKYLNLNLLKTPEQLRHMIYHRDVVWSYLGCVVLKPECARFDHGPATYVYWTMLANNLGSWWEAKHKRTKLVLWSSLETTDNAINLIK